MTDPRFKTEPYQHQLIAFNRFKDDIASALFFEQRVGKSKVALDIAAHKFRQSMIDSLLIVAPNDVHYQWYADAIPEHMPEDVNYRVALWRASTIKRKWVRLALKEVLDHTGGLRILCINIDATKTAEFKLYANSFFKGHKVMTVIDESSDLSNFKSMRAKAAQRLGRVSKARLILDGTPVAAGPLGLWGQCEFLSPGILGYDNFFAFRHRYAELERKDVGERDKVCPDCRAIAHDPPCQRCRGSGYVGKNEIQVVKGYINLPELQDTISRFSTRVLRSDCHDLPPKIYQKIYFELPPDQRRVYDQLRETFIAELKSGNVITAPMVLTRYLRLQQITSGYLPSEIELVTCNDCGGTDPGCLVCDGVGMVPDEYAPKIEPVGNSNARLTAFLEQISKLEGPGIIWCKFDYDVEQVIAAGHAMGKITAQFDGRITAVAKTEAIRSFQSGNIDWFVSKVRSGGRGHDLAAANWVAYYSHDWSLRMRLQSEDRAQSLKKQDSVLYLDCIAVDTVDDKIVTALRAGKRISDLITGDNVEAWL